MSVEKLVEAYRHKIVCQLLESRFGTLAESPKVQAAWKEECAAKAALLAHVEAKDELLDGYERDNSCGSG